MDHITLGDVLVVVLLFWVATKAIRLVLRPSFWLAIIIVMYLLHQAK